MQPLTFSDVILESKANNVIGLEVALPNLAHALKAGPSAEWVQVKLTKKGSATYLTIEAQMVDGGMTVLQDVPIRVLNAGDLARHAEPSIPRVSARMLLPSAASMLAVVDRMRAACSSNKHLFLTADGRAREISLSASTEGISIRTYYRGVGRAPGGPRGGADGDPSQSQGGSAVTAAVNVKDFSRVLRAVAGLVPQGPSHAYEAILLVSAGQALLVHAPLMAAQLEAAEDGGGDGESRRSVGTLTFILNTLDINGNDDA